MRFARKSVSERSERSEDSVILLPARERERERVKEEERDEMGTSQE